MNRLIRMGKWSVPTLFGFLCFMGIWYGMRSLSLETSVNDWILRVQPQQPPDDNILIIKVDQASRERLGAWPFSSSVQQKILERLKKAGAKCAIYTTPPFLPGEPWTPLLKANPESATKTQNFNIYIGTTAADHPQLRNSETTSPSIHNAGLADIRPDADGIVRRIFNMGNGKGQKLQALPFHMAQALGAPEVASKTGISVLTFSTRARVIPNFSFWRVLQNDIPNKNLTGKICLIGETDVGHSRGYLTPIDRAPSYVAAVEMHALALSELLNSRCLKSVDPKIWFLSALLLAGLLSLIFQNFRPSISLFCLFIFLGALVPIAVWVVSVYRIPIPVTALASLGLATCLGSFCLQLMLTQKHLLKLAIASHQSAWLMKKRISEGSLNGRHVETLLHLIRQLLKADVVAIALPYTPAPPDQSGPQNAELFSLVLPDTNQSSPLKIRQKLTLPIHAPLNSPSEMLDGRSIASHLTGTWWVAPLRNKGTFIGWLLVSLGPHSNMDSGHAILNSMQTQLAEFLDELLARKKTPLQGSTTSPSYSTGLLTHGTSRALDELSSNKVKTDSDQTILQSLLASQEVGIILAEGFGSIKLINRFAKDALKSSLHSWNPSKTTTIEEQNAFELLGHMTGLTSRDLTQSLVTSFELDLPCTFSIKLEAGMRNNFLLTVTPLPSQDATTTQKKGALRMWPEHFVILLTDVTILQQVDALKIQLLERISFRARNNLAALGGYCDLLTDAPEMAGAITSDLKKEIDQLNQIFEQFQDATKLTLDSQVSSKATPVDLNRMVKEVIRDQIEVANRSQITIQDRTQKLLAIALVNEQALRAALTSTLYTCLANCRANAAINLQISESGKDLNVTIQGQGCVLSSNILDQLQAHEPTPEVKTQTAGNPSIESAQSPKGDSVKWIAHARALLMENKGTLEVVDLAGTGSEFKLTVPKMA